MDCSACPSYNRGRGQKVCLSCKKYKTFQIKDARRQTIRFEIIPQAILEQVEDLTQKVNILEVLRKLPLELSAPVLMYWILGATQQEIADYHGISQQAVVRKNRKAIDVIKQMMRTGC